MALRDHFRSPVSDIASWEALHGQWPAMIVVELSQRLPLGYSAHPQVHVGPEFEIDIATYRQNKIAWYDSHFSKGGDSAGTVPTAYAAPAPTLVAETEIDVESAYEVRVYDTREATSPRRLVAAIELVSPANKDRPESRRAFVAKCATLIAEGVSVTIIDIVTIRNAHLYRDLISEFGHTDPALGDAELSVGTCRLLNREHRPRLESWAYPLALDAALPTIPLWLNEHHSIPLELEDTYQQTCRVLRIA